jgi:hypothetical protein
MSDHSMIRALSCRSRRQAIVFSMRRASRGVMSPASATSSRIAAMDATTMDANCRGGAALTSHASRSGSAAAVSENRPTSHRRDRCDACFRRRSLSFSAITPIYS